jgi:hypothetical protein
VRKDAGRRHCTGALLVRFEMNPQMNDVVCRPPCKGVNHTLFVIVLAKNMLRQTARSMWGGEQASGHASCQHHVPFPGSPNFLSTNIFFVSLQRLQVVVQTRYQSTGEFLLTFLSCHVGLSILSNSIIATASRRLAASAWRKAWCRSVSLYWIIENAIIGGLWTSGVPLDIS